MVKNNKAKNILDGIYENDKKFYSLYSGIVFR